METTNHKQQTTNLKRVLILAYDYPPYASIAGQRPSSWYRYLKEFGVEPVVVTRHWDIEFNSYIDCLRPSVNREVTTTTDEHGTVIRVPYTQNMRDKMLTDFGEHRFTLIRKAISFLLEILKFYSFSFDNRSGIYREAKKVLSQNRFDAIIATAEPFILFRYAQLLSKESGIPWIADYRDGWSTDRINPATSFVQKLFRKYARHTEKKLVPHASLITTASPTYKGDLEKLFPGKQIEVVYNGYDNDTVERLPEAAQDNQTFRIAYAGTVYPFQHLETFLEGFREFIATTKAANVKAAFIGAQFNPGQAKRIMSFDASLTPYLELTGKLPYKETLLKLKEASVLLLLGAKDNNTLSAKIFDYLALQRLILFVQNDHGVLEAIMKKNNGGICCENAQDVCAALTRCYTEHNTVGKVPHQSTGFEEYSRKEQAKKLAGLLAKRSTR